MCKHCSSVWLEIKRRSQLIKQNNAERTSAKRASGSSCIDNTVHPEVDETTAGYTNNGAVKVPQEHDEKELNTRPHESPHLHNTQLPGGALDLNYTSGAREPEENADEDECPYDVLSVRESEHGDVLSMRFSKRGGNQCWKAIGSPRPFSEKTVFFRKHGNGRVVTIVQERSFILANVDEGQKLNKSSARNAQLSM